MSKITANMVQESCTVFFFYDLSFRNSIFFSLSLSQLFSFKYHSLVSLGLLWSHSVCAPGPGQSLGPVGLGQMCEFCPEESGMRLKQEVTSRRPNKC